MKTIVIKNVKALSYGEKNEIYLYLYFTHYHNIRIHQCIYCLTNTHIIIIIIKILSKLKSIEPLTHENPRTPIPPLPPPTTPLGPGPASK
ncbi:hypothetical protein CDL12_11689 [Handroanthus impetiginosus]|uniref:Uncharacterized protein n=1 Tax=Handroanthus impetiginosus TaxID=429701 RepID=A0A2G9HDS1_9LAMI|nr:hypothetical protein CDL12_11689 [Handroanthus impetiginosus]